MPKSVKHEAVFASFDIFSSQHHSTAPKCTVLTEPKHTKHPFFTALPHLSRPFPFGTKKMLRATKEKSTARTKFLRLLRLRYCFCHLQLNVSRERPRHPVGVHHVRLESLWLQEGQMLVSIRESLHLRVTGTAEHVQGRYKIKKNVSHFCRPVLLFSLALNKIL